MSEINTPVSGAGALKDRRTGSGAELPTVHEPGFPRPAAPGGPRREARRGSVGRTPCPGVLAGAIGITPAPTGTAGVAGNWIGWTRAAPPPS